MRSARANDRAVCGRRDGNLRVAAFPLCAHASCTSAARILEVCMPRARALALATVTLTAVSSLGCWAIHNVDHDADRSPVVNTGAGATIIYPGQSAPMHPGNYHPRESGYGQGAAPAPGTGTTQS